MMTKHTYAKLAAAALLCLKITSVLFATPTSLPSEVRLTVDADTVTHTMRGGFGASWHAIERPNDKPMK
jgi:hypothetical protein